MDFGQLLGNESLKTQLAATSAAHRLTHGYLLCGPQGSGKHTLSQVLMAAMQCTAAQKPCWHCNQCRKVMQAIHPDIVIVDDAAHKTIPVEQIRRICCDAYIRPNEGFRKIYLIPRAQDLGLSGQNALLKVLEEPPSTVTFLLLCENPNRLLPTIRSRCVELKLQPLPEAQLLSVLQQRYPARPQQDLLAAAQQSNGFLGQALALLEAQSVFTPQAMALADAFAHRDPLSFLSTLILLEKLPREEFYQILQQSCELFVQAMLSHSNLNTPSEESRQLAANRTMKDINQAVQTLRQAMTYCQANVGIGHICGFLAASLR